MRAEAIFGDAVPWQTLRDRLAFLGRMAAAGDIDDAAFAEVAARLDLPCLIDYILLNCWMTNLDWPGHNYLIAQTGERFRFLSWDAEWVMRRNDGAHVNMVNRLEGVSDGPAYAFLQLCFWPEFRRQFAARFAELTEEGGNLHPAVITDQWNGAVDSFRRVQPAEAARWGGNINSPQGATALWNNHLAWLNTDYLPVRTGTMDAHFRKFLSDRERKENDALAAAAARRANGEELEAPRTLNPGMFARDISDRDGDGIPDEWEKAHGMNERDPSDALADADGDGLSNLLEFTLGTDPGSRNEASRFFAGEPSGVASRAQVPRIRNSVRVSPAGRPLSQAEAAAAAAAEGQAENR